MTDGAANTLWATAFVDELARSGVRDVVIAPGSRSTPLVMAFAADGRFRARVHLDERSAGFFALGAGKATGAPVVVVTTSGTAVANLLPAVVEASQSGVPMLVLTADRPHRLRDADANQAIDQPGIYGGYVRAFFEAAPPTADGRAVRHLRALACRACDASTGAAAGPVHVNFPFDKPLEPRAIDPAFAREHPLAAGGRSDGVPWTAIEQGRPVLSDDRIRHLADRIRGVEGVIVAGPSEFASMLGPAVRRLGAVTGWPVLADPLSGARFSRERGALVVAGYDLFLRDPAVRARLAPGLVLRVGASPTSVSLQTWLSEHAGVPQVVIDDAVRWKDHGTTATHYLRVDAVDTIARLARELSDETRASTDTDPWRRADSAAMAALTAAELDGPAHEGDVVRAALGALPDESNLVVSSSMPIREVDAFGHPRDVALRVFANRGASGIDGVVSTAFGVASRSEHPTACIIGDVALFHDQNGLLWSREPDAPVVFVLIDNDGGGIFHMLPIAGHEPHFTKFFATPHGLDPHHAAAAHGIDYAEVAPDAVTVSVERAVANGRTAILRIRTDRVLNHARRSAVAESVARSVRDALG